MLTTGREISEIISHTVMSVMMILVMIVMMFQVKVGNQSVVYTGDYNMTPDRHLGAAWIDRQAEYSSVEWNDLRCENSWEMLKFVHLNSKSKS